MNKRIHILGASGSGTTSIAKAVCSRLGYSHFDSDNYFWENTEEPFTVERDLGECLHMMQADLRNRDKWVLSGSLSGWGDILIPLFDLVVFVYVPKDTRMERLKMREYDRYGDRTLPGGDRYEKTKNFLEWAASYDGGTIYGRSLAKHEAWLATVKCPVIQVVNHDFENSVEQVIRAIEA